MIAGDQMENQRVSTSENNGITFKTRHNSWSFVTDILIDGKKVGYIIPMSTTGVWRGDRFFPCTDYRIFTLKCEQRGQAKNLSTAKALVLALRKQKLDIGKYERRS